MNGDVFSELVLVAACLFLFWQNLHRRGRPGMAFACAGIALTAALGAVRYAGFAQAAGPHRFFVILATCAALPLLADAVAFPDGEPARTRRGAGLFLFVASLVAVVVVVALKFEAWTQLVPGLSTVFILAFALRTRRVQVFIGALVLAGTFALMASGAPLKPFNPPQVLHYGMALALLLMCGTFRR
jgi:hypothetical protein